MCKRLKENFFFNVLLGFCNLGDWSGKDREFERGFWLF